MDGKSQTVDLSGVNNDFQHIAEKKRGGQGRDRTGDTRIFSPTPISWPSIPNSSHGDDLRNRCRHEPNSVCTTVCTNPQTVIGNDCQRTSQVGKTDLISLTTPRSKSCEHHEASECVQSRLRLQPHIQDAINTLIEASRLTNCPSDVRSPIEKISPDQLEFATRLIMRILRHEPERYGVQMESMGWVSLTALANILNSEIYGAGNWSSASVAHLLATANRYQRFEITATHCRATYGHSTDKFLPCPRWPTQPHFPLYHGTQTELWPSIAREGLLPMSRRFVQLSSDPLYAYLAPGESPQSRTLIQIDHDKAMMADVKFYVTGTHAWLATSIPPSCLKLVPTDVNFAILR